MESYRPACLRASTSSLSSSQSSSAIPASILFPDSPSSTDSERDAVCTAEVTFQNALVSIFGDWSLVHQTASIPKPDQCATLAHTDRAITDTALTNDLVQRRGQTSPEATPVDAAIRAFNASRIFLQACPSADTCREALIRIAAHAQATRVWPLVGPLVLRGHGSSVRYDTGHVDDLAPTSAFRDSVVAELEAVCLLGGLSRTHLGY